jgi:hypothetical protein
MFSTYINKRIRTFSKKHNLNLFDFLFYLILIFSFIIRIIDLNYNSAFNDEAIYIVIGRMGLFQSDWWSYGANQWMAGLQYIYPTLSALAYQIGGLLGSRLLNIILGTFLVEEVYRFTRLINLFDRRTNQMAALIAAFLAGFSGIGIFVSKLATYDLLSFLLLLAGINCFLKSNYYQNGKYYFLTFICLFSAFLTKIVAAFFYPLLFFMSLVILRKRTPKDRKLAISYLYIPFIIGISLYSLSQFNNFLIYITTHRNLGLVPDYGSIINLIWKVTGPLIILSIPLVGLLLYFKKSVEVISLLALASVIPLYHLYLHRYATLDKHLYLTVIFLATIIGYGLCSAFIYKRTNIKIKKERFINPTIILKYAAKIAIISFGFIYIINSYQFLLTLEHEWKNSLSLQTFLSQRVKPGDKVLTENGAAVILALYDTIFPPKDIITFDWIDYAGLTDNTGYTQALADKYFDYIELDNQFEGKDELKNSIKTKLISPYILAFKNDDFEIYEKKKN